MCPLGKKWPRFGSNFKKMAKKISNGECDGERKIYPSVNPATPDPTRLSQNMQLLVDGIHVW